MLTLYAAVFWVSAATLFFELTLTRLFSVTQWYHFAFMSVSVALLGFGGSGTWLSLRSPELSRGSDVQRRSPQSPGFALRRRLSVYAALFSAGILIAYLAMNHIPFDSYRIGWERRQLLYLLIYYSCLILPFFFAGCFIGLALAAWPSRATVIYAANLLGSAVGSLATLLLIPLLGGMRAVLGASMMAMLAAFILMLRGRTRRVYLLFLVVICGLWLRPFPWFALRISPYKALSTSLLFPGARIVFNGWNAFSRVDVVESEGIHSAPGLSLSFAGELPRQLGLTVDGGNLSPITCIEEPDDWLFLQHLTTALPFQLRPGAHVLLVEPRAGLDIWAALQHGAASVVALESNPLVVQAVREQVDICGSSPYDDPRVQSVFEEARSYLQRSTESFDVLLLSLTDTYQPVISGAYGLSESYMYTVEALAEYLDRLGEDGILVLTRWMQTPPSEELRACVLLAEALERAGLGDPAERVLALRSWSTATLLAKRTPFRNEEIARLKSFCAEHSFDLLYYPGMAASEANQFNLLPDTAHHDSFRSVLSGEGDEFVRDYPYDVSPPSDDRPFFFHYFRWVQVPYILRTLGKAWLPFGGSGFLILVVLFIVAAVLSLALIWMPLMVRRGRDFGSLAGFQSLSLTLLYFACLGLGFLFVEMPFLQQFILFLGQPAYAFSLVLFSILFFSALGSWLAGRMSLQYTLPVLVVMVLAYPWFLSRLFALAIHWALPLRLAASVLGLAPLGFLLGIPMPGGIRLLEERAPQLIPWAWAINGCASVIGSILAVMGAVTLGFSRVLAAGAVAYLLAWFTVRRFKQPVREASAA